MFWWIVNHGHLAHWFCAFLLCGQILFLLKPSGICLQIPLAPFKKGEVWGVVGFGWNNLLLFILSWIPQTFYGILTPAHWMFVLWLYFSFYLNIPIKKLTFSSETLDSVSYFKLKSFEDSNYRCEWKNRKRTGQTRVGAGSSGDCPSPKSCQIQLIQSPINRRPRQCFGPKEPCTGC